MPVMESDSIATSAAVGSNALAGVFGQIASNARVISRVALVGSSAVGDAAIEFYIGTDFAGKYRNTTAANAPIEAKDWITVNKGVLPNAPLNLKLVTAPTTNSMRFFIEYVDL